MGASFKSSGAGIFEDSNLFMNLLRAKLIIAMQSMVDVAVQKMVDITQSGRNVITRDMLNAIGGKVYSEGINIIVGEFGFENSQQLYYILQSGNQPAGGVTGFTHVPDGKFIESDFAMRDAFLVAVEHLLVKLQEPLA